MWMKKALIHKTIEQKENYEQNKQEEGWIVNILDGGPQPDGQLGLGGPQHYWQEWRHAGENCQVIIRVCR